ncbi:MAG TPA: ATP-binding protein [Ferruginibacter sp.]|nr:ATP-binding protein [Ferruginibacter sp.]
MIKKIVVVGPESTGKSSLCEQLAEHYHTVWVKEYAREYLLKNRTDYSFENLLDVARGQIENEELAVDRLSLTEKSSHEQRSTVNDQLLFIDTDMYVMKVWCEFVFDKCHHWILNRIVERKYDLYLLCNIDLPWVKDELREYPDLINRQKLYHHYKDILINQHVPWIDISGNYEERLQKAVEAVDQLF